MTTGRRSPVRPGLGLTVIAFAVGSIVAWLGVAPAVQAAPGAQTPPTLTPTPVATAATNFKLSNGTCDGTAGAGWRVQTFIVNAGVDVGTLVFDEGVASDQIGSDRDNTDGSIASPLFRDNAPGTGFNPAASPAGLINPADLDGFDFSDSGWVLSDGDYQIGYACISDLGTTAQWWTLTVTIDADASPNPFMVVATDDPEPVGTAVAVTANPASSTIGTEVTFTATATPSNATGSVEFFVDGASESTAAVSSGTATWTTSALTVGTKAITATFTPTEADLFTGSTSQGLSFTVSAADAQQTTLVLTADPADESTEGENVTLTATIAPSAVGGTVTFSADGFTLAAPVAVDGGVATLTTNDLEVGDLTLLAAFTPSDPTAFTASNDTLDYSVLPAGGVTTTVTLSTTPASTAPFGQAVTVTATISPSTAVGDVVFARVTPGDASVTVGILGGRAFEVANGAASVTISDLPVGQHALIAEFVPADADAFKSSSSLTLSFTVTEAGAGTTSTTSTTSATPTSAPPAQVQGQSTGQTSPLASTGGGLLLAGVGVLLVYLGRIAYLLARPREAVARR